MDSSGFPLKYYQVLLTKIKIQGVPTYLLTKFGNNETGTK